MGVRRTKDEVTSTEHRRARRHDKPFKCGHCGGDFMGDRSRHEKTHLVNPSHYQWKCPLCGFASTQKYSALDHFCSMHSGELLHECEYQMKVAHGMVARCGMRFKSAVALCKHKKEVHKDDIWDSKDKVKRPGTLKRYEKYLIPPPCLPDAPPPVPWTGRDDSKLPLAELIKLEPVHSPVLSARDVSPRLAHSGSPLVYVERKHSESKVSANTRRDHSVSPLLEPAPSKCAPSGSHAQMHIKPSHPPSPLPSPLHSPVVSRAVPPSFLPGYQSPFAQPQPSPVSSPSPAPPSSRAQTTHAHHYSQAVLTSQQAYAYACPPGPYGPMRFAPSHSSRHW